MGGVFNKEKKKGGKGKKSKGKASKTNIKQEEETKPTTENGTEEKENNPKEKKKDKEPSKKSEEKESDEVSDDTDEEDEEDIGGWIVSQSKPVGKEDFELLAVIGRGSFGKVMQVRKKDTGKIYAMKVMRKDAIIQKNQVTHTKDEKSILQKILHPFIVQLHFAFQTRDKLYMILDYVNGGELFYHLKKEGKFSVERVKIYAAEIASAMSHLHAQGIVYRDLKPENILLDNDGHIIITDFGLSKEIPKDDSEGTHTFCGTPEYLAPEVLRGQGHGHGVDWWSLGTLIYEMLTGLPPFYSKNINLMYQKILSSELTFPSYISEDAQDLLEGLLTRDPDRRFGSEEVKEHPFFKDIDWDALNRKEIEPPWKPQVKDETDISQIDVYFTSEDAVDSYVDRGPLGGLDDDDKDMFKGFTYAGESELPS